MENNEPAELNQKKQRVIERLYSALFNLRYKRDPYQWEAIIGQALVYGELIINNPPRAPQLRACRDAAGNISTSLSDTVQVIVYALEDQFTDTRAAGSLNGTAATPGPGTRVVIDTDGDSIAISGGYAQFTNPNNNWTSSVLGWEVHPIALGNVNRVHSQIRILAEKLLKLHLPEEETAKIDQIVDMLTKSLYSHTHAINRDEAINILGEDWVATATDEEQELMWQLYEEYAQVLELRETFCADSLVESGENPVERSINGGFIETKEKSFVFQANCRINLSSKIPEGVRVQIQAGQPLPLIPGTPLNISVNVLSIGWKVNEEGV